MEDTFDIEIYTPPLSENRTRKRSKLQAAINALSSEAQFAILESLTDICFPLPSATEISLDEWPKGRLFSPLFELRWEKSHSNYWAMFVMESDFEPPKPISEFLSKKDSEIEAQFWRREEQEVYLWPENEPRLGRSLDYQCLAERRVERKQNVRLRICQYYDDHGRLIFWRYKNMRWTT